MRRRLKNRSALKAENRRIKSDLFGYIRLYKLECVLYAVNMGTFVPVGGINARADKAVAQIIAGVKRGIGIGTVEGVNIKCIVEVMLFGKFDKAGGNVVIVRTVGILNADGDLMLLAFQSVADAAHVNADNLFRIRGNAAGAAVADFFKHGEIDINFACQ